MTAAPVYPAPVYNVAGRQPEVIYITPSRHNPWYGSIIEGRRFTYEQGRALVERRIDPLMAESVTVRRSSTPAEVWTPLNTYPDIYEFQCPVLSRRADGKIKVVSPCGDAKYVSADGWVGRPPKKVRGW